MQEKTEILEQKIYDFLLYLYPLLIKYPKFEKFSLQSTTRNAALEKLLEVTKWKKTTTKSHRYMDDFIILSSDIKELRRWLAEIEEYNTKELNPKTTILCCKNGVDFVGYRHRPTHRKVRRDSVKRIKRKIRKYITGKLTKEELLKSLQSWTGHAEHADSYNLRAKINALARTASGKGAGE